MRKPAPPRDGRRGRPHGANARPPADRAPAWTRRPPPDESSPARLPERADRRGRRVGPDLPPPERRLRNVRLTLEYDGARFHGWQVQAKHRTVAGVVLRAIHDVLGEEVLLMAAGRTDDGVHAEGQVANFLTRSRIPSDQLLLALQRALPDDVGLLDVRDVGPEFHARHSAVSRVYRYHVARRPSVFLRGRAWVVTGPIHLRTLREATALIRGWHDFASFTDRAGLGGATSRCEVTHADWKEVKEQLVFRIASGHFLPRMVRRLVGSLVRVGTGEISLQAFRGWLDHPDIGAAAVHTAPAMGLFLEHAEYPSDERQATSANPDAAQERPTAELAPSAADALAPAARRAVAALERAERSLTDD